MTCSIGQLIRLDEILLFEDEVKRYACYQSRNSINRIMGLDVNRRKAQENE